MRRLLTGGAIATAAAAALVSCTDSPTGVNGTPVTVTVAPCTGASTTPSWFAVQDGDGSWTQVTPAAGVYTFTVNSGKAGIAQYTADAGLSITYGTTDEIKSTAPACNGATKNVTGTVTGYSGADNVGVFMGAGSDQIDGGTVSPAAFLMSGVEANAAEVVAIRRQSVATASDFQVIPNNVLIRRGVSGTSLAALDFASPTEAGAPLQKTVTITNSTSGDEVDVYSTIYTATTVADIAVHASNASSSVSARPFYGLPATRLVAGETQGVEALTATISGPTTDLRIANGTFSTIADMTLAFGSPISGLLVDRTRPSAKYTIQPAYNKLWEFAMLQNIGTGSRQVSIIMTAAYLGTATEVTLAIPDLTGVPGFNPSWLFASGTTVSYEFDALNADLSIVAGKSVNFVGAARLATFIP